MRLYSTGDIELVGAENAKYRRYRVQYAKRAKARMTAPPSRTSDVGAPYLLPAAHPSEGKKAANAAREGMRTVHHHAHYEEARRLSLSIRAKPPESAQPGPRPRTEETSRGSRRRRDQDTSDVSAPYVLATNGALERGEGSGGRGPGSQGKGRACTSFFSFLASQAVAATILTSFEFAAGSEKVGSTHGTRVDREGSRRSPPTGLDPSWPPRGAARDPLPIESLEAAMAVGGDAPQPTRKPECVHARDG